MEFSDACGEVASRRLKRDGVAFDAYHFVELKGETGGEKPDAAVEIDGEAAGKPGEGVFYEGAGRFEVALEKVLEGEPVFPSGDECLCLGVEAFDVKAVILAEYDKTIARTDPGLEILFRSGFPVLFAEPRVHDANGYRATSRPYRRGGFGFHETYSMVICEMKLSPIPVAIRRAGPRREFAGVEFRDPPEGFPYGLGFQYQLAAIVDVLKAAASAEAKNGTGGIDPEGRGGKNIDDVGAAVIFRRFGYFAEDFFARD